MNLVLIDSSMAGISGDKLLSALADLLEDRKRLQSDTMKALRASKGVQHAVLKFRKDESAGISGTMTKVEIEGGPKDLNELRESLERGSEAAGLGSWGWNVSKQALDLLIDAETEAHGLIDFHELCDADTIADIVGSLRALEELDLEGSEFYSTPVAVGYGSVKSMHGTLPVPAPATLWILKKAGIPIFTCTADAELTTPTGAALLAALTKGKHAPPAFKPSATGVGIGNMRLQFPNITRVIAGEGDKRFEGICVLETNVDDVDGEVLGWIVERLQGRFEDVSITPMITKKNRPGHTIRVTTTHEQRDEAMEILFRESGTLGIKVLECMRAKADRAEEPERVMIGKKEYSVMVKRSARTGKIKPSSDDCKKIASAEGMSLMEVIDAVKGEVRQRDREKERLTRGP